MTYEPAASPNAKLSGPEEADKGTYRNKSNPALEKENFSKSSLLRPSFIDFMLVSRTGKELVTKSSTLGISLSLLAPRLGPTPSRSPSLLCLYSWPLAPSLSFWALRLELSDECPLGCTSCVVIWVARKCAQ